MARRKVHKQEENVESWLMSYADMITLLLAFFVIFVSTSEPKQNQLAAATRGMQERFGTVALESPYDAVYKAVAGIVQSNNADRNIAVEKTAGGMRIELSSLEFFSSGSAEIAESQLPLLEDLARTLKQADLAGNSIVVEGHTNDDPVKSEAYASNWELAAARATRVVRLLIEQGIEPGRLSAVSYGKERPAVPNTDAQGNPIPLNRDQNQRVVIKIERQTGSYKKN